MKSMTLGAAIALAGALYVMSPAAKADVMFGSLTPTPACGPVGTVGSVCGINETFTSGGDTVVAHGFTGAPGPAAGDVNLTLKPMPLNGLAERAASGSRATIRRRRAPIPTARSPRRYPSR